MQTPAQADGAAQAPQQAAQQESINLAAAAKASGASILRERQPYRVPASWLARRCGVPLVTALALMPAVAQASDGRQASDVVGQAVATALTVMIIFTFLTRRRSLLAGCQRLFYDLCWWVIC